MKQIGSMPPIKKSPVKLTGDLDLFVKFLPQGLLPPPGGRWGRMPG